ncbi:MAG: hypothetical protein WCS42_19210, partial [Verrucomicrobiota bacterium]
ADSPVNRGKKSTTFYLAPYAYSGVSDKSVPPPKEGVFNVYSEDGVGPDVRVEFPIQGKQAANNRDLSGR